MKKQNNFLQVDTVRTLPSGLTNWYGTVPNLSDQLLKKQVSVVKIWVTRVNIPFIYSAGSGKRFRPPLTETLGVTTHMTIR